MIIIIDLCTTTIIRLTSWLEFDPTKRASTQVQLSIKPPPLALDLGGSLRTQGLAVNVSLRVQVAGGNNQRPYIYDWSCIALNGTEILPCPVDMATYTGR